jgi:DNA-binding protein HU-beta
MADEVGGVLEVLVAVDVQAGARPSEHNCLVLGFVHGPRAAATARMVASKEGGMNRRDLVRAIAAHSGVNAREVETVLQGLTDVMTAVVAMGEPVSIAGFAKFMRVDRPARTKLDPDTQQPVHVARSVKARITPLKVLKEVVSGIAEAPSLAPAVLSVGQQPSARSNAGGQVERGQHVAQARPRRRVPTPEQNWRRNRSAKASPPVRTGSSGKVTVSSDQQRRPPRPSNRKRKRAAPHPILEEVAGSDLRRCSACGRERPAKDFPARFSDGICIRCKRRAERARATARKPAKRRSVWTVSGGGFESNRRRH